MSRIFDIQGANINTAIGPFLVATMVENIVDLLRTRSPVFDVGGNMQRT